MKVIAEKPRVHYIRYLRFYYSTFWTNLISNCMVIYMFNTECHNCVVNIRPSELTGSLLLSFQNQIAFDQDNDKNVLVYIRASV